MSDESGTPRCEDCGATSDALGAFNRPSGTPGHSGTWHTTPGRADVLLGRPGYLCTRHWWARAHGPLQTSDRDALSMNRPHM